MTRIVGIPTGRVSDLNYDDWRRDRSNGLGGSDAAAIMGVNKYRDSFCTYVDKVCTELPDESTKPDFLREAAYWGTTLEPIVAAEFCKQTGYSLIKPEFLYSSSEPGSEFLRASLDYLVVDPVVVVKALHQPFPGTMAGAEALGRAETTGFPTPHGELSLARGILDVKTCSSFAGREWVPSKGAAPKVSAYAKAQLQHYMLTTGLREAWACCLIGGQQFVWVTVPFDEEYSQELLKAEATLWDRIQRRDPPAPDTTCSDVQEAFERWTRNGGSFPVEHGGFQPVSGVIPGW